ncbi:leucine-rich repeat-containing protein 71 isoform X2 [Cygnus olor]|uniref:leucine-rich repeat-containing protein 71 isoform X2 n=1 Tax=Cygnus olor TaxID=8869 RepID=UPI001ADDF33D|nr:leucine-rich repeat-containing protein 71 isoform X2 [Cygnus olor]
MRRRRERTPREKVAAAAAPEEEARNVARKGEQGAEEYQCSGLLEQDLAELCARAGIAAVPAVTPRPSPADPAAAEGEEPAGPETHTQRRHGHIQRCVQVETEHDDPQSVREVFVRGWNIEEEMLGVLGKCLPALAHLRAVHLWRAGLTDRLLPALTTLLARCPGLGTLSLEGNPLPEHSFHLLMGPGSTLSHLSLRNNGIGDEAARLIGQSLSTLSSSNRSLVSLVLSFNHISDVGAGHIAQGLRWNRSLLSLSLAHNDIGDVGALRLAEVLGPFALTHAEVVERRRLLLAEALGQPQAAEARSEHAPSLQGSAAAERLPPAKHNKGTAKKKPRQRPQTPGPPEAAAPKPPARRSGARRRRIRPSRRTRCWSRRGTAGGNSSCRGTARCSTSTWPITTSRSGAWAPSWPCWRGSRRSSRGGPRGGRGCCASRCRGTASLPPARPSHGSRSCCSSATPSPSRGDARRSRVRPPSQERLESGLFWWWWGGPEIKTKIK